VIRCRFFFLLLVLGCSGARAEKLNFKVLVRVADSPLSTFDRDLEYYLRNPTRFRGQYKVEAKAADLEELLNRLVVESMIFEENKVVGNVELSTSEALTAMKNLKNSFGSRWKEFLNVFDQSEASIKDRLHKKALVDRIVERKIEAFLRLPQSGKEKPEHLAQKGVDEWLLQLRNRYKIQVFE
jgi:hypothetical protein